MSLRWEWILPQLTSPDQVAWFNGMIGTQEIGSTGSRSKEKNSSFCNSFSLRISTHIETDNEAILEDWAYNLAHENLTIVTDTGELDKQQDKLYQAGIHGYRNSGRWAPMCYWASRRSSLWRRELELPTEIGRGDATPNPVLGSESTLYSILLPEKLNRGGKSN